MLNDMNMNVGTEAVMCKKVFNQEDLKRSYIL